MLALLALALPVLALLGGQQPPVAAGNASALVGAALLFGLHFGPNYGREAARSNFWLPILDPNYGLPSMLSFLLLFFGPQLRNPLLYFLGMYFEIRTCTLRAGCPLGV